MTREDPRAATMLRHEDDEWVRKARRFQAAHERAGEGYDRLLLARRWPSLYEAFDLRYRSGPREQNARNEAEARLLAAEPFDKIGKRIGAAPDAVAWYEKMFFNVLDRLDNPGYISHMVIGERLQSGLSPENDYDVLWKMYGYWGKANVLDALTDRFYNVTAPETHGQVADFFNDDGQYSAAMKMSVMVKTIPVNGATRELIVMIQQKYMELRQAAAGGGAAGDMMSANLKVMINALPWSIGEKQTLVAADDPRRIVGRLRAEVAAADECSAELRADDLMRMNVGQASPRALAMAAVKFPEKTNESHPQPV